MGRPEASQPDLFVFTQEAETQNTEESDPKSLLVVQDRVVTAPTPQPWSALIAVLWTPDGPLEGILDSAGRRQPSEGTADVLSRRV